MTNTELENITTQFVIELINEGVWVTREGMDLQIKRTPYALLSVLNQLNNLDITIEDKIVNVEEKQITVSFTKLLENHKRPLQFRN